MFVAPSEGKMRRASNLIRQAGKIIITNAHRLGHLVNRHLRVVKLARDTALERHLATSQHRQESRLHRLVLHRVLQVLRQLDAGLQFPHSRALHRAYLDRVPGVADLHREGAVLDLTGDGEIHVGAGDVGSYRITVVKPCRGGARFPKRAVLYPPLTSNDSPLATTISTGNPVSRTSVCLEMSAAGRPQR